MVDYFRLTLITVITVAKVMLCAVVGMGVSKYFINPKKSEKGLTYISVQIFLPCLLFSNLCLSVTWEAIGHYYWAPIIACLPILLGTTSSFVAKYLLPKKYQALLILGGSFQNGLTFPLSIILNLKGVEWFSGKSAEKAQSYIFLYNIMCSIGLWAIGEPIIVYFKKCQDEELARLAENVEAEKEEARGRQLGDMSFALPFEEESKEKRSATSGEQLTWYRPPADNDNPLRPKDYAATGEMETEGEKEAEESTLGKVKRIAGQSLRSPPVFVSLLAIFISLTPPLNWLASSFGGQIFLGGFGILGKAAIPLQLLVLGLTIMSNRSSGEDPEEAAAEGEKIQEGALAIKMAKIISPQILFSVLAVTIRLVLLPVICLLVVHLLNTAKIIPQDPIFLLTILVCTCSPSAINSSLICSLHDYYAKEYAQMIVVMYVAAIASTTGWLFVDILYVQWYYSLG
ncbi:Membrane transport protein, putative [Angomonas deanei]|uniref:Membrane transport protein, putative n=1 Tax=Angomonas deanei TaxID=59799 RepID=A0A7G2CFU2_9TRYP|nr:Membrane transport protein, putative [Angomonas deanei]